LAPQHAHAASRDGGRIVAVSPDDGAAIDLKQPLLAMLLAWLLPGAGHLYQGRRFKGVLFLVVILSVYFTGFVLGGGRVVYWSWKPGEQRWAMACQAGIGIAVLPAAAQSMLLNGSGKAAVAGGFMAPPVGLNQPVDEGYARDMIARTPSLTEDDFRRPPRQRMWEFLRDELSIWHHDLGRWFEIGTLYTMIAGMLNMLVIYDAGFGPLGVSSEEERRKGAEGKGSSSVSDEAAV
jgi:hypothetical protein